MVGETTVVMSEIKQEDNFSDDEDLYSILGIKHLELIATPRQISSAYKKASLLHHPDKKVDFKSSDGGRSISHDFLQLKKAYDVLMDPDRRRIYDSKLDFDESIPDKRIPKSKFFVVYDNVFKRNAIFSAIKPVPTLGDMNDNIDKVLEFYKFWRNFKTWRDFSKHCKVNLEEAETRWEKREMKKSINSEVKNLIKNENLRLRRLVNNAYESDPRIIKHFEDQKRLKKENRKKLSDLRKKEIIEKQNELEKMELERQNREEINKREEKERAKKQLEQNESIRLKTSEILEKINIDTRFRQILIKKMSYNDMAKFNLDYENSEDTEKNFFVYKTLCEYLSKESLDNRSKEWDEREVVLLSKAFSRYPAGTRDRWPKIVEFFYHSGVKRTEEEIISKATQLKKKEKSRKNIDKDKNDWNEDQQALLKIGISITKHIKDIKERWLKISQLVPNKTAKECVFEFKRVKNSMTKDKFSNN